MTEILSIRSAAEVLGAYRVTVWNYVSRGKLPATMVGNCYVIFKEDLEKFMLKHPKGSFKVGRPKKKTPKILEGVM